MALYGAVDKQRHSGRKDTGASASGTIATGVKNARFWYAAVVRPSGGIEIAAQQLTSPLITFTALTYNPTTGVITYNIASHASGDILEWVAIPE